MSVVVMGVFNAEEAEQNLRWVREFKPLTAEELRDLNPRTLDLAAKWGSFLGARD